MNDPIAVAIRVAEILETLGLRYLIGGSLASSMSGEPRVSDLLARAEAAARR